MMVEREAELSWTSLPVTSKICFSAKSTTSRESSGASKAIAWMRAEAEMSSRRVDSRRVESRRSIST